MARSKNVCNAAYGEIDVCEKGDGNEGEDYDFFVQSLEETIRELLRAEKWRAAGCGETGALRKRGHPLREQQRLLAETAI